MNNKQYGNKHFWTPWLVFFVTWFLLAKLFDSSVIFDVGWYFNTAGHAVFGILWMLSRCFLIHHPSYTPLDFSWSRWVVLKAKIYPLVTIFTVTCMWEFGEFLWDIFGYPFFPQLDKAQKGWLDTSIDIASANATALMTFHMLKLGWYKRKEIFPLFQYFGISAKGSV